MLLYLYNAHVILFMQRLWYFASFGTDETRLLSCVQLPFQVFLKALYGARALKHTQHTHTIYKTSAYQFCVCGNYQRPSIRSHNCIAHFKVEQIIISRQNNGSLRFCYRRRRSEHVIVNLLTRMSTSALKMQILCVSWGGKLNSIN